MNNMLRSASGAAILIGLAGVAPAWAQNTDTIDQTPQPAAEQPADGDRVVITGSFIQGTPEDAALPVEVFSIEELEDRGAPTALEFAKSLTIAGPTSGEAYYFGGPALIGSVNYNIRGIGADKTLTLLNGRRMSSNTSNIPFAALSRVEILKDGAAVIYGADATGGVVNFITRDSFEGLEVNAQYKYVDSSDGDYGISILGGFGDDRLSFLWSAEWEHRSALRAMDRDFTLDSLDPTAGLGNYNPAPWSTLTNLAGWLPLGPLPATPTIGANGAEFGAPVAGITPDFTPASCAAVDTLPSSSISPSTAILRPGATSASVFSAAAIDIGLALYASLMTVYAPTFLYSKRIFVTSSFPSPACISSAVKPSA